MINILQYYNKFKSQVEDRFLATIEGKDALSLWRARFFADIISLLIPLSILLYIPSVLMSISQEMWLLVAINTYSVVSVYYIAFNKRISANARITLFIITIYLLGLILLYYIGWDGPGFLYLFSISALSTLIHSKKAGFVTYLANLVVFLSIFLLSSFGFIIGKNFTQLDTVAMIVISLNFLMLNYVIIIAINSLINTLQNKIQTERMIRKDLEVSTDGYLKEKNRAEESESFKKLLLDTLPLPYFYKDRKGIYRGFNKAFENFFGKSSEELIGKSVFDTHPKHLAEIYFEKDKPLFEKISEQCYEAQVKNPNGLRDVIFHKVSLTNSKKEIIGLIGMIIDITEIRAAENEIRELNESLELKVEKRTEQLKEALKKNEETTEELKKLNDDIGKEAYKLILLNEKLCKSEEELKITNQTKDKFLSIIAHDLKNPLGGIRNSSEALLLYHTRMTKEDIERLSNSLFTTANHTIDLLENLLKWAQIQTGRMPIFPEEHSLMEVVSRSYQSVMTIAEDKNILVSIVSDKPFQAFFDVNSIETVIRNLIANALKFTHLGGRVEIGISDSSRFDLFTHKFSLEESKYILVYVKDNGVGISKDRLEQLFKIDENVSTYGTAGEQGTGLGLILCKEFVERNGGIIGADSEIGKGSIFYFTLPLKI